MCSSDLLFALFVAIQLRVSGSKKLFRPTADQFANLVADIALFDQRFTHEDCARTTVGNALNIGASVDTAFRDQDSRGSRVEGRGQKAGRTGMALDARRSTLDQLRRQPFRRREIHTCADLQRVANCGAGAILIGESLVKQGNIGDKIRELIGG